MTVGCANVVKTNVSRMSGLIDVDSVAGQGTKFTITLPITLAIIQAVIIRSAKRVYALPLASVLEIVAVQGENLCRVEVYEMLQLRGQTGMSAGNLVGSDIFNLLGVLGLAGLLTPMTVNPAAQSSIFLLGGMVLLVVIMMRSGWRLTRWEGGVLLLITMGRWILDFSR